MSARASRLCSFVAGVALVGLPSLASGQALWREGAPGGRLFTDHRARAVNDIVTIVIDEESASSRSANTKTSKDTSRTAGVRRFPTLFDPLARRLLRPLADPLVGYEPPSRALEDRLNLDVATRGEHTGQGTIERTDRMSARIPARVVRVLDNGYLVIEGRRAVVVNDETQILTISGVVRPEDISAANTVHSSQIADAEIQMTGRGVLSEAQRPGLLYRLLDWLRLF